MIKELIFEGSSDDTFGEATPRGDDYDNCASGEPIVFQIKSGDQGLNIYGQYGCSGQWQPWIPGCWVIGVQQMDEDIPIPDWPIKFETSKRGYSPRLVILVPADATLTCLNRQANGENDE